MKCRRCTNFVGTKLGGNGKVGSGKRENGQKFLPPQSPSFLPARASSFLLRQRRSNQSEFRSKKVRASFSNCDQSKHCILRAVYLLTRPALAFAATEFRASETGTPPITPKKFADKMRLCQYR